MRVWLTIALLAFSLLEGNAEEKIRVGLIGDSTVATTYGWGPAFADRCKDSVEVHNHAKNGGTLKALTGNLDSLLKKKPHYVLIQFGHNDMKRYDTEEYSKRLSDYVRLSQDAGAKVVVLSSVTRRTMTAEGKIRPRVIDDRTLADYAKAAREVAQSFTIPFIDLNAITIEHHNRIGPEATATYNFNPKDKTHFSPEGARQTADLLITELHSMTPELTKHFNNPKPQ